MTALSRRCFIPNFHGFAMLPPASNTTENAMSMPLRQETSSDKQSAAANIAAGSPGSRCPSAGLDLLQGMGYSALENLPLELKKTIFSHLPAPDRASLQQTSSTMKGAWHAVNEAMLTVSQRKAENRQLLHAAVDVSELKRSLALANGFEIGDPLIDQVVTQAMVSLERLLERGEGIEDVPQLLHALLAQAGRSDPATRLNFYERLGLDLLPRCGDALFRHALARSPDGSRGTRLDTLIPVTNLLIVSLDDPGLRHDPKDVQQLQKSPKFIQENLRGLVDDFTFWSRGA